MTAFKFNLLSWRTQMILTQAKAAEALGLSLDAYQELENNPNAALEPQIRLLCEALAVGLTKNDFLVDEREAERRRNLKVCADFDAMTTEELYFWRTQIMCWPRQEQAAAAFDVHLVTYQQWERGAFFRTNKPMKIDRRTALACAALAAGLYK